MFTRRTFAASSFLTVMSAAPSANAGQETEMKVVYHLSDLEKVPSVLGNIHNHYAGMGGDPVKITLVVQGPALRAFTKAASLDVISNFRDLVDDFQLEVLACANSLKAEDMALGDLLAGFGVTSSGVVTIAHRQAQGYAYIRP
jgi:intracellular sulfur oxidation DsrE/DsrF family protein